MIRGCNREKLRKRNELRLILLKLLKEKPKTRNELCKALGYNKSTKIYPRYKIKAGNIPNRKYDYKYPIETYEKRTTIYDNLIALEKAQLIEKTTIPTKTKGRPKVLWKFKP